MATSAPETFVIAGGGSIGLSVAYYLALECRNNKKASRILVVDAFEELWNSASSYNTGVVSHHYVRALEKPLAKYSFDLFKDLSEIDSFRSSTSIRNHAIFSIAQGGHQEGHRLPSWVHLEPNWHVIPEPADGSAMSLKPKGLASWLLSQCEDLGVNILRPATIIGASTDRDGKIDQVHILQDNHTESIPCNHLVLSAGAWTLRLLKSLFPDTSIDLQHIDDGGSWMIIKNPQGSSSHQQATVIMETRDFIGSYVEFMAQDDGTIWICSDKDSIDPLPQLERSGVYDPIFASIGRFKDCAKRVVRGINDTGLQVLEQGLCYRPTNKLKRPVIAEVTTEQLGLDTSTDVVKSSGLYLCTGHSYFGISLGLGTGKIMSALLLGQEPDIDIRPYSIPESVPNSKK